MGLTRARVACLVLLTSGAVPAQQPSSLPSQAPLPDVTTLMREVEEHQKAAEALLKNYTYHSFAVEETLDGHGNVKKTETEDDDVFFVAGTEIRRRTRKNGQPLSSSDQKKESERVDKAIAKAKERADKPDADRDIITVSRFLELGSFSNPRRVSMDGRSTIAIDFTGNPRAKTHNRFEGAIREMAGTLWIDEQDRALRRVEGRFVHSFKVGGGLLADIKEGTSFQADWTKVNGEVWLPRDASGQGSLRVLLLLHFNGRVRVADSNYRKFRATAIILPGLEKVEPSPAPGTPPQDHP